ncbi:MAG: phosphoribosylanthranilate isomerase [Alphaproteobacteria bacterium]|nr:phosphoribosylanthranilate isomerase [Alphaproteobacteria bacterium]
MTAVKICGITDEIALQAAAKAGAQYAGFVFYPKSPRNIVPDKAAILVKQTALTTVGLFVDPDDETLRRILSDVPLKMIQLHGNEPPERVAAIKSRYNLPVMKALRVATAIDITPAATYAQVADWLLFDAKVDGAVGGTGQAFDWTILKNYKPARPWMLAGGLTPDNVGEALIKLAPDAVDVSSGVESSPGIKDACKIAAFVETVRHAKHSAPAT